MRFTYEIEKDYGIIGGTKADPIRVRLISYNGRKPKLDIRNWYMDYTEEKMGKGITLKREDVERLREVLDVYLYDGELND